MSYVFTPQHHGGSGEPLVLIHGFTDSWRTWELVLPGLERRFEVLAPTLRGHAGGPKLEGEVTSSVLADAIEDAMDAAGFETAHFAGNSLGGYVSLQLAERGRARSVVALAPAGGWNAGDLDLSKTLEYFSGMQKQAAFAAPHAHSLMATEAGRRACTQMTTVNFEHIPADLLAHQLIGVADCEAMAFIEFAGRAGYPLDASKIECPVRIVWGVEDKILRWPRTAERYRRDLFPHADWVELDGVGHCPQLDVPLTTQQLIIDFAL